MRLLDGWAPTDSETTKQPQNNRRVTPIWWQCIWSSLQGETKTRIPRNSWPWHIASLQRRYAEESSNFVPGGVPKIYICMLAPPSFIGIPLNGDLHCLVIFLSFIVTHNFVTGLVDCLSNKHVPFLSQIEINNSVSHIPTQRICGRADLRFGGWQPRRRLLPFRLG